MNRQLGISTGVCVGLVLIGVVHWETQTNAAQEIEKRPATTWDDSTDPGAQNQALIDEIRAIRKLLGGGIAQRLEGLDLGKPGAPMNAEQVFNEELDRLAKQTDQPGGAESAPLTPPDQPAPASQAHVSHPLAHRSDTKGPASSAARLRSAARCLDDIAADLEDIRLFRDADEIRGQARMIWYKARQFESRNDLP